MGKQKYTSEGTPIDWDGCDYQYYELTMRNVFDEQKMVDLIDDRYDKTKLITAEG